MDEMLNGRVFLVAGSSRGIGRSIALALAAQGACVCITGRSSADLVSAARCFDAHAEVLALAGDLADARHVASVYGTMLERWGHIDGLVANVGTGKGTTGWKQPLEEWQTALEQNLFTSVRLSQAAVPHLSLRGGTIVFIASITGVEATPAPMAYSAAKAALLNYSKNLSRDLAAERIRVNAVAPGNILFDGGSWDRRLKADRDATMHAITETVPLGRFGAPEEIASLVAFLCSDRAAFITGSCFVADGGQTRSI